MAIYRRKKNHTQRTTDARTEPAHRLSREAIWDEWCTARSCCIMCHSSESLWCRLLLATVMIACLSLTVQILLLMLPPPAVSWTPPEGSSSCSSLAKLELTVWAVVCLLSQGCLCLTVIPTMWCWDSTGYTRSVVWKSVYEIMLKAVWVESGRPHYQVLRVQYPAFRLSNSRWSLEKIKSFLDTVRLVWQLAWGESLVGVQRRCRCIKETVSPMEWQDRPDRQPDNSHGKDPSGPSSANLTLVSGSL